jgi:hypothetical protein
LRCCASIEDALSPRSQRYFRSNNPHTREKIYVMTRNDILTSEHSAQRRPRDHLKLNHNMWLSVRLVCVCHGNCSGFARGASEVHSADCLLIFQPARPSHGKPPEPRKIPWTLASKSGRHSIGLNVRFIDLISIDRNEFDFDWMPWYFQAHTVLTGFPLKNTMP